MLTILQVIPSLEAGGAERTTIDIAGAITAAGGKALVASEGGRLEGELAQMGGELLRLPVASKNPLTILANAGRLEKIIRERNVSVIHARSRAPAWSALLAARSTKIPFVTTHHGAYNAKSWLKKQYNSVMAAGAIVIANSEFTGAEIAKAYKIDKKRIAVIPRGTDFSAFDKSKITLERALEMKAKWGLAGYRGAIILCPARLTRWKGQLVFIEALAQLKREGGLGDAMAVLAGDAQGRDAYVEEVRSAIKAGDLDNRVKIVGHVEDMPVAYAASSLVVSASTDPEAFGRVIVEASAMGLPVIATDHGGARETVITEPPEQITGWLTPPGDAKALTEAIAAALALSPEARAAMGARGSSYVRHRYSREAMCRATLQVYLRVIDGQI
ncbi:MAG TPA: glycosyltransferase family 4 protein [Alphaproteobacteria bacterium]|nr:glycosyltransferase family 4 protein [Alphaproteobacteria bacterium]